MLLVNLLKGRTSNIFEMDVGALDIQW